MQDIYSWSKQGQATPGREVVSVKLYQEKDPQANPYYASNQRMRDCVRAAKELINSRFEWEMGQSACESIDKLYQQSCGDGAASLEEKIEALKNSPDKSVQDTLFYLTHVLFVIEKLSGGHRYAGKNDTEIQIKALLLEGMTKEAFYQRVRICSEKNHVCWCKAD